MTEKNADQVLISCENLVKIYPQIGVEVVALQGLDLRVMPGEIIGIVGESGSGKSTLLNVLGGLDHPSAGKVSVAGQDLLQLSEAELDQYRSHQVGFIWQQTTRNLVPYLTALENVELPMRLTDRPDEERSHRAEELLDMVGLGERVTHLPAQLSGGEQQRVAIAVALANNPPLLLADEPTGELDTATAQEIYNVLQTANQTFGTTILIVSHDAGISQQVDRVISIRDGKTSTETVRVQPILSGDLPAPETTHSVEELLVLDAAGRVQIPREVLEALEIGGRVRLEVKDKGVILHPVEGHRREKKLAQPADEEIIFLEEEPLDEPDSEPWWQRIRQRLTRRQP